jgi:hypothetical protein
MMYSQIDPNGYISASMYTEDPNFYVPEGYRLLPDNPPQPPQILPGFTRSIRVEPVPMDATEVEYNIVQVERNPMPNEVIL